MCGQCIGTVHVPGAVPMPRASFMQPTGDGDDAWTYQPDDGV